jgi:anhydro-N-acetylmuramic acid kinase
LSGPAQPEIRTAIGLMSGTSMDGVDAALLRTDGRGQIEPGASVTVAYGSDLRNELRASLGHHTAPDKLVARLTDAHAKAAATLLDTAGVDAADVDVVGFHGHTILHQPWQGRTIQIGDGNRLAKALGIDVVNDFRSNDVAAGGQGAPLVPLFHAALSREIPKPLAVLNIGGVSNVTWIGDGFDLDALGDCAAQILAFDCGPGNALLDDWVFRHTGHHWDEDGALAASGRADTAVVERFLTSEYFERSPPKSLDRNDFRLDDAAELSAPDGAATLARFSAAAISRAPDWFAVPARQWLVCGGGRRNPVLMAEVADALGAPVASVESVGWDGDALEAQAFAWLAVRALDGLALTLPTTTGVARPLSGGQMHRHL